MKKIFVIVTLVLVCLLLFPVGVGMKANAAGPLDEIQDYEITVHMRPDGTMDIRYHIEWKVLDDSSEGPLEWVKIGNPNMHVDEITAISDNIKDIFYMADRGSYIRVDFDRAYYEDEIVSFDYTIHQSYMYVIEKDSNICRYSFTPGWFEEIEVKNITIKWSDENVIESTCHKHQDGYLIWQDSLEYGERLNASVKYNLDVFTTNENEQYTAEFVECNSSSSSIDVGFIVMIIIIVVLLIWLLIWFFNNDDYYGGFGGGGGSTYVRTTYYSSCARSSCACVSRCACACACAGGGRAGCSTKEFYRPKVRTEILKKVLKGDC